MAIAIPARAFARTTGEKPAEQKLESRLLQLSEEVSKRWEARAPMREQRAAIIADGRSLAVETPYRLAARVNRLLGEVRRKSRDLRPPSSKALRGLLEKPAITERDLTDALVKEAVVEARDFLSVEFLERGLAAARCVGRIVRRRGAALRPLGTGFLVGPGLLITNEHVLTSAATAGDCLLEMDYELNAFGPAKTVRRFALDPQKFFLVDAANDFALVAVVPRALGAPGEIQNYGWLPLDGQQGKISLVPEDMINIIQHPLGREKEIVIRDNRVLDFRIGPDDEILGPFIHYEADTEKGSSGSPVLNDQWEVVALHHSGVPRLDARKRILKKDGTVWNEAEDAFDTIAWVANEGVRVSSIIASVERARLNPAHRALLDGLLSAQAPGVLAVQTVEEEDGMTEESQPAANGMRRSPHRAGPPSGARISPDRSGFSGVRSGAAEPRTMSGPEGSNVDARLASAPLTFEVPLRVSVEIAYPSAQIRHSAVARAPREDVLDEKLSAEDYFDRAGFDEEFLGVSLPLPKLKRRRRFGKPVIIDESAENPFELKYHHYSVVMNEWRRLAYLSAVNIDFGAPAKLPREKGTKTWRLDPRVPEGIQVTNEYYANNDYDRGHLTRRDDAAWGEDQEEALAANNDTFHWTNAAPQHLLFNQSDDFTGRGLRLWGDLENHVSSQGAKDGGRLCVLNGPVYTKRDKRLQDIRVPERFFKIVAYIPEDGKSELAAVGFLLSQKPQITDEGFEVGEFAVRQVAIAAIDKLVDLDLAYLVPRDRLDAEPLDPNESLDEDQADERGRLLESLDDIVL